MDNKFSLNIDTIPKELKLILKLINSEGSSHFVEINKEFQDVDWKLFLEFAMHHRLYPLLYGKLKKIKTNLIPPYVEQILGNEYKRNTFEMLHLSGEMERVNKIFNENQIRMLVLKGPVLAKDFYGDLSLRTCGDLDILVSINELEKVDRILQKEGYLKDDFINKALDDWKWRNHHIKYNHPKKRTNIEIHWRLNPFPGTGPSFEKLWLRKRQSSLTSYPIYYLGREDLFLFLVSHGARHGWFRLRWLVDINQLTTQRMDWEFVYKQLRKYQYLPVGGQAIVLTSILLGTPINIGMKRLVGNLSQQLAQDAIFFFDKMVNLHTEPVPVEVDHYHKKHLYRSMTKRQKCLYVLSFLYPYPLDVETLPLPKSLHILYFPLRPFLWAWRKTRKHALS
jgi:hypothetical protein